MSITQLTRATFIAANHAQIALSQKTMYELAEGKEGVKEVPIPESFKKSGIPQGYSVGVTRAIPPVSSSGVPIAMGRFRRMPSRRRFFKARARRSSRHVDGVAEELERDLNLGKNPHEDKVGAGGQSKLSHRPMSGGGDTFTKPMGGLRRLRGYSGPINVTRNAPVESNGITTCWENCQMNGATKKVDHYGARTVNANNKSRAANMLLRPAIRDPGLRW
ncbi:uncharacterized protein LACBIDRAFT_331845 [Laccaria bicolor S238N-H82]|uniref:Predicted protein n=1 Tax=Laccaria bicolor (strain S238N-H82 / ATCC MYA-4686) TaxID=486041 RepID=B0DQR4_LACBS|nr:uncharacterized protein LACBIDRAFT_331845 [Laccaria bicolor S238N-H82]EDR03077.1 predicted protein [Laccaria bicolor S238N-H82]|eukprot:XP_001886218.1 predicted protein [Laccaria bicolor S238N-H82]